jgi:hypothetical protein
MIFFLRQSFRATFGGGLLGKLSAKDFLLYQRANCLLLTDGFIIVFPEKAVKRKPRFRD